MSDLSAKEVAKRLNVSCEEYILRKRLPEQWPKRANDVYINMNTNFSAQLKRCQQILDNWDASDNEECLVIHGLGRAINRAINMALQLQVSTATHAISVGIVQHYQPFGLQESYQLNLSCNTSSVEVVDEFEPIGQNESFQQKRTTSAIHIKLYHKLNKMQ